MGRLILRLLGAAALGLAVLLALLAGLPPLLAHLPPEQVFLRAYAALILSFLCISLSFGVMGALSAGGLPLREVGVRPQTGPWRLAVTLAVSGGLLVIPGALLSVLGAVYQPGAFGRPVGSGSGVFMLLTGLYGLLAGALLGLLVTTPRHVWRVALGGLLGGGLSGAVVGWLAGQLNGHELLQSTPRIVLLVSALVGAVHVGWGLGVWLALRRLARLAAQRQRALRGAPALQVWLIAGLGLLTLSSVSALTRTLGEFVTSHAVDETPLPPVQADALPACPPPTGALERAVWQVSVEEGRPDLACGNSVLDLIRMPGGVGGQPDRSGFDDVADLVRGARREVLFTTMQWEAGEGNPGSTLARALADLYARVKAEPTRYPQGVDVKITLGNYPVVALFEWGAQVWAALDDLRRAGVPLDDPAHRWQVHLGNYAGTFPHSHVKLLVIDGQTLVTAGFNYGYQHYPRSHSSGQGEGLFDLALVTRGPQTQVGLSIFDDLWTRSKVVSCPGTASPCRLGGLGRVSHPPGTPPVADGDQRVYSFYRRAGFTQADQAIEALYRAAQERIDLMHVNFSMDMSCIVALLNPSLCSSQQRLPFMTALLDAMSRGVQVRLLADGGSGLGGIENRIALAYLQRELRRRHLPATRLQARWFPQPLHAKASLVDDQVLVIGSMNLHHSSWTQGLMGLNEAVVATPDPAMSGRFRRLFDEMWAKSEAVQLPQVLEVAAP